MTTKKSRILLVEDDPSDAQLVTEALGTVDPEIWIEWACDGEDGLRHFADLEQRGQLPDLVILDYNLPKMSGPELFMTMRSTPSLATIPTIMLTSSSRDCDRAACAGVDDYLIKGSTWSDTLEIAHRIVRHLRRITQYNGSLPMSICAPGS